MLHRALFVMTILNKDQDAQAWQAAVYANGGSCSGYDNLIQARYCKDAKQGGWWSSIYRDNGYLGDQLAAVLVPLKAVGGNALDTNHNFVAADFNRWIGLKGDGTKYLSTGFIPSTVLSGHVNDVHIGQYNCASSVDLVDTAISGAFDGTNALGVGNTAGGSANYTGYCYSAGAPIQSTGNAAVGALLVTRTSATSLVLMQKGAQLASSATSNALALPTVECYIHAVNSSGTPIDGTKDALGGYTIGTGLTNAFGTLWATAQQRRNTALNRQVAL